MISPMVRSVWMCHTSPFEETRPIDVVAELMNHALPSVPLVTSVTSEIRLSVKLVRAPAGVIRPIES